MGKLTLNVTKSTDTTGGISYGVDIADADLDRLSVAYAATYFPQGAVQTPAVTNPDGTITAAVMRAPTAAEVVTAIANGLANGMFANVHSYEVQQASAKAVSSVTPINGTPAQ